MATSWAAFGIFMAIGFLLFIFVIVRTVYRCYTYHNCCQRCKGNGSPAPQVGKPGPLAMELQKIGDAGQKNGPASETNGHKLERNKSELFDPSKPLVLPVHGIHYPEPGEDEDEDGSSIGGHNLDFSVENIGYDEPDRERQLTSAEAPSDGMDSLQQRESFSVTVQDVFDADHDKADIAPAGNLTSLDKADKSIPDAGSQLGSAANTESDEYQNLNVTEIAPPNYYAALVKDETPNVIFGIENPLA